MIRTPCLLGLLAGSPAFAVPITIDWFQTASAVPLESFAPFAWFPADDQFVVAPPSALPDERGPLHITLDGPIPRLYVLQEQAGVAAFAVIVLNEKMPVCLQYIGQTDSPDGVIGLVDAPAELALRDPTGALIGTDAAGYPALWSVGHVETGSALSLRMFSSGVSYPAVDFGKPGAYAVHLVFSANDLATAIIVSPADGSLFPDIGVCP